MEENDKRKQQDRRGGGERHQASSKRLHQQAPQMHTVPSTTGDKVDAVEDQRGVPSHPLQIMWTARERCSHNSCQCGIVWHQCDKHRTDPLVHASRKGVAKVAKEKAKEESKLSSTRRAPRSGIQDQPAQRSRRSGNKGHRQKEAQAIRHVKFVASTNKPSDNIIKRLRMRLADQKEAKSNQRREAIARIKPTCHQIEASPMRNAGSKDQSKWNRSHLREYLELKAAKQRDRTKDKLNEELKNSMHDAKRERKWIQGERVENHFPTNISHAKRKKDSISQDAISRLLKKSKSERQANMSPNV